MKLVCDRGALAEALGTARMVVTGRSPKPVLNCVKLVAEKDRLVVTATDLEIGMHLSTSKADITEPGTMAIPADKLLQIVRESTDPTLTIESEQEAVHIRGQDSHFKVHGYSPADYPAVPAFSGSADFVIPAGTLGRMIEQTYFAAARENSRYAINGVLFEREGPKLAIVATDGHRLALTRTVLEVAQDPGSQKSIVPPKTLQLVLNLMKDPELEIKVRIAENQILFQLGESSVCSTMVEGNFPPYRDVIPKELDRKAHLLRDALLSAVKRAALLTNEESKGVRFSFTEEGLVLSSRAPEMGEAEIKVPLSRFEGEPIDIGFNPGYVLDALKAAHDEHITIELRASGKPGILRTGPDFLYVVMPVSL
ncbi:MAG: DNA polymerase III subunit beta [Phycisphaeraceae bacterium]|nr:DNA polymerase III subunit beta [Phycisphaeraceae bacterium]